LTSRCLRLVDAAGEAGAADVRERYRDDDRNSHVGRLDEAMRRGWTAADMKRDWKKVFAFEQ
jgi:hypothetical protein